MRTRQKRPTQADIARHAGVSPAVVSLVLNNRANDRVKIAEATQQRVQEAIRELGYVPNTAAQQLAKGRTNVIGVFTYEAIFPMAASDFYQPFLVGIEHEASARDYNLLLLTGGMADGKRSIYRNGANQLNAAEGAILLGANRDSEELEQLWGEGFPFVFVGRREINGIQLPATAADYAGASRQLIDLLVEAGHRQIHLVVSGEAHESLADRMQGVHESISAHYLNHSFSESRTETEHVTPFWLRQLLDDGITAIAASNLRVAITILEAAQELGVTVPDHFSLVALGNSAGLLADTRGIASFSIPYEEMGAQAVEMLDVMLSSPRTPLETPRVIPCEISPGRTIAPPMS